MRSLTMGILAASLLAAGVVTAAPALADGSLSVELSIGSGCVSGHKPSDQPVTVKLRRSNGQLRETKHDDTQELEWLVCFDRHIPAPGDRIQLINGSFDRTVKVPDLTLGISRVSNVIEGHAPAGKQLRWQYTRCDPGICTLQVWKTFTVPSTGRYHKDLSPASIDIDGNDAISIEYRTLGQDVFRTRAEAPYFEVNGDGRLYLSCLPAGDTSVKLRKPDGTLRATAMFQSTGTCRYKFGALRKSGDRVSPRTGNAVISSFASDAKLTWPSMALDASGDTMTGRCLKLAPYIVYIQRGNASDPVYGMTDATGHFTNQPGGTFQSGDKLDLICETPRGDRVRIQRTL